MMKLNPGIEHSDLIEAYYQMKDGMLVVDKRAPLGGYALRRWAVDCTSDDVLDPPSHHFYLSNSKTLYGGESDSIAPGYLNTDKHSNQQNFL
jgi:hypothetical protein